MTNSSRRPFPRACLPVVVETCQPWAGRGRRNLSTREGTSFVDISQTENGRVLSWRAHNLPSFAFCHDLYLRRLKSFFTALFTIRRAVDRPCYRCVHRGDRTCVCGNTAFSIGDHRQSWCVPIVWARLAKVHLQFAALTNRESPFDPYARSVCITER